MNRLTNWLEKPITWGGYFKLAAICAVVGSIPCAIFSVMLMEPAWWVATKDFVKRLLHK